MNPGPSFEEHEDCQRVEEEKRNKKQAEQITLKFGRTASLQEMLFVEDVRVGFWLKPEQDMRANRIIAKYDVLWQNDTDALVQIHFVEWEPDHDYDTKEHSYSILSEMKKHEVIFVTNASLRKFDAQNKTIDK